MTPGICLKLQCSPDSVHGNLIGRWAPTYLASSYVIRLPCMSMGRALQAGSKGAVAVRQAGVL